MVPNLEARMQQLKDSFSGTERRMKKLLFGDWKKKYEYFGNSKKEISGTFSERSLVYAISRSLFIKNRPHPAYFCLFSFFFHEKCSTNLT